MAHNPTKFHRMSSDAYNNITFTGQFRHGVDAKNRLTIPADWRSGEEGVLYVRLHTLGTHVIVMSPDQLDKKVAMIEGRADLTPGRRWFAGWPRARIVVASINRDAWFYHRSFAPRLGCKAR